MFTDDGAVPPDRPIFSCTWSVRFTLDFAAKPATLSLKLTMRQPSETPTVEHSFSWMIGLSFGQSVAYADVGPSSPMPRRRAIGMSSVRSLTWHQRHNVGASFMRPGWAKGIVGIF